MAKIKYDYDSERGVFYFYMNGKSKDIISLPVDEDTVYSFDTKAIKLVGIELTNFDAKYPKMVKLFGTKNEELAIQYFEMYMNGLNAFLEKARDKVKDEANQIIRAMFTKGEKELRTILSS